MITYVSGNLFESPARTLVNTVNIVGVMGKGIAKTFKTIYPEMFKQYQQLCESGKLTIGKLWLYKTSNKWILNFPTKTTWRRPSRIEYIEKGLEAFVNGYAEQGITNIAFPALGCGNGELDWENQIRLLMEKYLKPLPIDIFIYIYRKDKNIPEHKNIKEIANWLRSEPESLVLEEIWIDLQEIIGTGIQLNSFYSNKPFNIYVKHKEKSLMINIKEKEEIVYYEELKDFWNTLRSYGFIFPAVVPPIAEPYEGFLLALFSKLPYCRVIVANKNYNVLTKRKTRGLQFVPPPAIPSSPLFNETPRRLNAI